MNRPLRQLVPASAARRGFTLLEFIVAMVVFGIALAGMLPLVVILSRNIRPVRYGTEGNRYYYRTPARDWESDARRDTWYVLPFSETWARKLGASARITDNSDTFDAYTPTTASHPAVQTFDDDADTTDSDSDGNEDYTDAATDSNWQTGTRSSSITDRQDYRYHETLATAPDTASATWTFTVATAGYYSLQASWPTDTGKTLTTVTYDVALNSAAVTGSPFSVNQASPGNSVTDTSGTWYPLSTDMVYLSAGTLQVTLNVPVLGATTSAALADGMRLVPGNDVVVDTLVRTPNSKTVTANVTVTLRIPK